MTALWEAQGNVDQNYSYQQPATGFSIIVPDGTFHLILDPAGALATGTVTMPANVLDGQVVNIRTSQAITALTIQGNTGQSVKAQPTTLAAGKRVDAIFNISNTTWFFGS